jgi:hypothetical protein
VGPRADAPGSRRRRHALRPGPRSVMNLPARPAARNSVSQLARAFATSASARSNPLLSRSRRSTSPGARLPSFAVISISSTRERNAETLAAAGVLAFRGCLQAESGRVFSVESPRESAGRWRRGVRRRLRRVLRRGARRRRGLLDRRVSESELDDFRVLALGDEYRCVRVPEVVSGPGG